MNRLQFSADPMSVRLSIPPTLRRFCHGHAVVHVEPGTVSEIVTQLQGRYNGIGERLCDKRGRVRGSVLIFVNNEDIRFLANQETEVKSGDQITIIPAFAGG